MRNKILTQILGTAALAGSLTANALAQNKVEEKGFPDKTIEETKAQIAEAYTFNGDLKYSLGEDGFHSQNLFTLGFGDNKMKVLLGSQPEGVYEAGFDLTNNDFRINAGFLDNDSNSSRQGHISGTLYFNDNPWNFLGGSAQFTPAGDTVGVGFLGHEFSNKLNLQAILDTEGNARGAAITPLGPGLFSAHAGLNSDSETDFGFSYNTERVLTNIRFGESRNLDASLVIGNVPKENTKYWAGVQGNGINDLGDMFYDTDRTFKFDIGNNPSFDFFGPESKYLGREAGDAAIQFRVKEDQLFRIKGGYRLGDLGPLNDLYAAGGVDLGLKEFSLNDSNTYFVQTGFQPSILGDNAEVNFKVQEHDGDVAAGVYLQLKF